MDDELDWVGDLMRPIQPLLTQAVTDDYHSEACCTQDSYNVKSIVKESNTSTHNTLYQTCTEVNSPVV